MRRILFVVVIGLAVILVGLWAQIRNNPAPARQPFEVMSVFPREIAPGEYRQVDQNELRGLAEQGWELVSVMPYIYRNEEHNNGEMRGPKPVVTQTYPAYFFKRERTPKEPVARSGGFE